MVQKSAAAAAATIGAVRGLPVAARQAGRAHVRSGIAALSRFAILAMLFGSTIGILFAAYAGLPA